MIRGHFSGRLAIVKGRLLLPRLQLSMDVDFLLDTGAWFSVVHPQDIKALGVDVMSAFSGRPIENGIGIGGMSEFFIDEAIVAVRHDDGVVRGYRFDEMRFALPTDYNADHPSLLGMDFIGAFELLLNSNNNRVELS